MGIIAILYLSDNYLIIVLLIIVITIIINSKRLVIRDGPLLESYGAGEGNFRAAGIFFRYQIPCMNFFQVLAWIFLRVNWRARIFLN